MLDIPIWYEYAVYDENGIIGVREDSPEDVKTAYNEYVKEQKEAEKTGIKL